MEKNGVTVVVLISLYALTVFADLGANLISVIPVLGDLAETASELILETIGAAILGYFVVKQ